MTLESNRKWVIPSHVSTKETIVTDLLLARGVDTKANKSFLNPSLTDIPSCERLYGAKKAAKQIVQAIKEKQKIFIHGDFDVDGISATAIMWEFLYRDVTNILGEQVDVHPYIPDRVDEGYGLSKSSIDAMLEKGAQVIITVDCGVRDRLIIEEYMEKSPCTFIITDHHQPPEDIKKAKYTIVHQMFPGKEFPEEKICGAFVAFLLTLAIRSALKVDDTIHEGSNGLDLVALATVADMMPLVGVNRVVVKYGLEQMKMGSRVGLKSLFEISGVELPTIDSYHLGFVIGPRINAAGRIGSALEALRLLVVQDNVRANEYSTILHNLNVQRQEKTLEIFNMATAVANEEDSLIFIIGDDWHEGIIGLVAGKLMEKYGKPVIVTTKIENGQYKGSARSLSSFNITDAIANFSDSLERYGGHAQAAGFTVKLNEIEKFRSKLIEFANGNLNKDMLERTLELDARVDMANLSIDLYNEIERLKPFGYGNSKPLVMFSGVEIIEKILLKNGVHMKLKLKGDGGEVTSLMFNCSDDVDTLNVGDTIDVASYVVLNEWNGYRNVELQIKEWRK